MPVSEPLDPSEPPGDDAAEVQRGIVRSVLSASTLLGCFRNGRRELRMSDLAREVGLNVSTAHRLLQTLVVSGLLEQDATSDRYSPGPVLMELAEGLMAADRNASTMDILSALAARTGESISLGARSGSDAVVLMHVPSAHPLRFERKIGDRIPLHASALGKVLLAWAPEDSVTVVRDLAPLFGVTPATITTVRGMTGELRGARERGYAVSVEEEVPGIRSVSAPVLDSTGIAIAAVEVSGPCDRLRDGDLAEFARILAGGAGAIQHVPDAELLF
jgi:IclR family acetate operon transcriptional repressor